jgi:hypothetical protein
MEEVKNFLKETDMTPFNNWFYDDEFFDLYCQEVFVDGPNTRYVLGVVQHFDDDNKVYSLNFNKSDSIIAYLILAFDWCDLPLIQINSKNFTIEPSIKNLYEFLSLQNENNLININADEDLYDYIKSSLIYHANSKISKKRAYGNTIKSWEL